MKKLINFISLLCLALPVFAGCNNSATEVPDDGVTAIELRATGLKDDTLTIMKGNSTTIACSVKPSNAHPNLKWTVKDENIAKIDGSKLSALEKGTTTLTVSAAKVNKTININVEDYVPLTGIQFSDSQIVIESGVRKQLKYSLVPENATTKTLTFSVSPADKGVKVSDNGIVEVSKEVDYAQEFIITAKGTKETNATGSITLKIKKLQVEDILLLDNSFTKEITSLEVPLDEPYRVLFAMVEPEKALPYAEALPVTWTSSDTSVVNVSSKGRLTFNKTGNSTITMECNIDGKKFTKTCDVTVTEPSGNFIENYHIPQNYISSNSLNVATSQAFGWQTLIDFRNGGTASPDAKKVVFENYKPQTGPSSWFAGGGYCVEMGGWDNIHSGLEDDDLPGGGMSNLFIMTKTKFTPSTTKIRTYFEYRQTDATFKYKLRHTLIDVNTKDVIHLTDWQTSTFNDDIHLIDGETYIESAIPENWRNKDVMILLEYDDIDYTVDHILNGCESVNIKYFTILNDTGEVADNALWVIGDSNTSTEFTGQLWENIASDTEMTLFRDTISGRTIAPASSIGIVDHVDTKYYENNFEPFGSPKVICIQCGGNDMFWANQPGNSLKIGEPDSDDKTCTYGAIKYILSYFNSRYPDAKIIFATTKYRFAESNYTNQECDSFNTNLREICSNYSNVSIFEMGAKLWNYANQDETTYNSLFISDHIHFNTLGQSIMRDYWVEEINKVKPKSE